jgi:hypothetical protein
MSEDDDYDWDSIAKLLLVVEKSRDLPKLKPLHDAAMAELEDWAAPDGEEK